LRVLRLNLLRLGSLSCWVRGRNQSEYG